MYSLCVKSVLLQGTDLKDHIAVLVVNYGISNIIVLETPLFTTKPVISRFKALYSLNLNTVRMHSQSQMAK